MTEQEKLEKKKKRTKRCCITITVLFITCMLIIPLVSVIVNSLKEGIGFYIPFDLDRVCQKCIGCHFSGNCDCSCVNTFFGICAAWLLTKFFIPWKADLSNPDRYSVFNLSG